MCAMLPGLQCDIFRLHEDDVIGSYMRGDFSFPVLLNQWIKDKLVTINQTEVKFWNGSYISLEHCSTDSAMSKHQGIPKHVRAFDEAGQIPERRMKWLTGWMILNEEMKAKLPEEYRDYFPKVLFLSNPIGPSKPYLRNRFVKARPKFEVSEPTPENPWRLQYIPYRVEDNPSEDAATTRARVADATDPATAKALLNEDWDAQTGNFFEMWDSERHVIKPFMIPDHWIRFRTFDYGSYEPWACLWWAISPGVTIHAGTANERYIPRYCLVCYREWYGCKAEHPETERDKTCTNLAPKGWSNADMANGIIERTEERFDSQPTFTDGFPFNRIGNRTIAAEFAELGVKLTKGDLGRENRASMTISKLNGEKLLAGSNESWPMMVFFDNCKYCQDYIPMVERHKSEGRPWDYTEDGEATHIVDCVTLAAVMNKTVADAPTDIEAAVKKAMQDRRTLKPCLNDIIPGGLPIG